MLESTFNQLKEKCKNVRSNFGVTISPLICFSEYEKQAFELIHSFTSHNKGEERTIFLIDNASFHQFKQFIGIIALIVFSFNPAKSQTVIFNASYEWNKYSRSESVKTDTAVTLDLKGYRLTATRKIGKRTNCEYWSNGKNEYFLINKKLTSYTVYNTEGGVTYFKNGN